MNKQRFIARINSKIPARWHMSLICLMTIASGILISKLFLYSGMSVPMIRYGLAVLFSYAIFFLLIYWWLQMYFGRRSNRIDDHNDSVLDAIDITPDIYPNAYSASSSSNKAWAGGGGDSAGAGASTSWGDAEESISSSTKSDFLDGDLEEIVAIIAIFALIAAVLGSTGYLIVQAPEILFEAAFEVVLAAGLVKQAKKMQADGWKLSIFKKTWWLCAVVLVFALVFGYVIKNQCPEASSFAEYRQMCKTK